METQVKLILGVIAILLVGLGGVFIAANSNPTSNTNTALSKQLLVTDVNPSENTIVAPPENEEDDALEGDDVEITGTPLEKASAAALAHIGEGRVTDSEIGDEESYYEIEITLENGEQVDVQLDENFNVVSTEYEGSEEEDDD